jgi:glycosyltransferase involved in cell wall biosynthesis
VSRHRFAIFLPVRNGAQFLAQAIDSIVAQTRSDWSLIVLDNASTDGSADLALAYRNPKIQLHRSEVDLPIWESWQRVWSMLANANADVDAEYTTIIGHDDVLLPTFLESIEALIEAHPTASLYQTPFDMIDERGTMLRPCRPIPALESSDDLIAARMWGLRDSVGTGYVFRSADYVTVGGIPNLPFLLYADDLLFSRLARLSFKAASRDGHCLYRLHRQSASLTLTRERIEGQIAAVEQYLEVLSLEAPDLMKSRSGRSALACFLAREIMVIRPLARSWLLQPQTCERIRRLEALYTEVALAIDYRQWLGTNVVTRDLYALFKQIMLLAVLLKSRVGRSARGNW